MTAQQDDRTPLSREDNPAPQAGCAPQEHSEVIGWLRNQARVAWCTNAPKWAEKLDAFLASQAGCAKEVDDDVILKLVYECFPQTKAHLTITSWKDGIDVDRPSYALRTFVRRLLAEAASPPPPVAENAAEQLRTALLPCIGWLEYAYRNVDSATATAVKAHLPTMRAIIAEKRTP